MYSTKIKRHKIFFEELEQLNKDTLIISEVEKLFTNVFIKYGIYLTFNINESVRYPDSLIVKNDNYFVGTIEYNDGCINMGSVLYKIINNLFDAELWEHEVVKFKRGYKGYDCAEDYYYLYLGISI